MAGSGIAKIAFVAGLAAIAPSDDAASDPLDPARTVRRALADARMKAFDVGALVVSAELVPSSEAAIGLARRALGPRGDSVVAVSISNTQVIGRAVEEAEAQDGVAIALLYSEGSTLALCAHRDGGRMR